MRRVWLTLALLVPLLIALTGTEAQPAAARAKVTFAFAEGVSAEDEAAVREGIGASDVAAYLTWSATQSPNPIEVRAPEVRFDGCGEDYYASFQPVLGQDNNHPAEQDTKPVKGAVFFDEFYNTCMVRVTDHANEPPVDFARNDYSRRQAFNADSSRFVTISHDGYWHLYDGVTLEYLKVLTGPAGDSEIQWHPTDPNLLFYLPNSGGMVIYQYDIRDDSSTIVGDFGRDDRDVPLPWPTAARVWTKSEGSPSADGRYWGFQVETSNFEPLGLMVWDMQTDEILGTWDFAEHGVGRPDHVSMSPSGEYIVPSWDGNAYGTTAFSRDFTQQVKLHHKSEHSDLALLPNGHDAYVSVDYQSNAGDVFMVEIQTGQKTVLFPTYLNGTATALHVSGKAFNRPGWILMSTYSTEPATHWLHKKLFAVELKADPTIVNLAHTHVVSNGYWSEPHASVNRDFTRVIFNSNWDTGSDLDVDAYIVVLPNRVFQESSDVVKKFDAIPTSYLFIGNSLTGNNDGVHTHFEALMTEAGHDIAIAGEIYGGQDFESHYNRETTRAEIEQGSAEVVVPQGNSYEPIYDQEDFHTYGGLLAEAVYAADKKPLYFMTWHHQDSPAEINTIQPQYEALGIDQASPVVPVGLAVKEIVENHPDITLYSDGTHSNLVGTFLASRVFYAFFTHGSPEALTYDPGLPEGVADTLKSVAWQVVSGYNLN